MAFKFYLEFIVEVTKIMVLPMGFHNLQKLLPWEYLFKKEEKIMENQAAFRGICQFFQCYATEFQESGSGFKIKLGIEVTQFQNCVVF